MSLQGKEIETKMTKVLMGRCIIIEVFACCCFDFKLTVTDFLTCTLSSWIGF